MSTIKQFPAVALLVAVCLASSGCWWTKYFYNSTALITTMKVETDLLYGTSYFLDPNRSYYGARTTQVEKNGYTTVNGTTNGFAEDVRSNLSVPNDWTFLNTNGPCTNMVTYNKRLVHNGVANLECNIDTGYNNSQYVATGLGGYTVDGDEEDVPEPTDLGTNLLVEDEQVQRTEALRSGNGDYSLILLTDGNLVLFYNGNHGQWDTNTAGSGATTLVMQGDGNLVLYTSGWTPVWSSGTAGNPGAYLNVQNDGNLVVYSASHSPLWSIW
jgi:hypothetical protein